MLPNHHITKPVLIGEIQADGQFDVVWKTERLGLVPGDAWSDFLPGSKDLDRRLGQAEVRQLQRPLSLGSVLLLAAIGLAITFGVMGVINMAHGEMVMLGAYTTFVVQQSGCRPVRLVAAGRRAARLPRRRAGRHRHRARRHPLSLRPPAGNAARDLRRQPDPAAGGALDLLPTNREVGNPVLDERRVRCSASCRSPTTGCGSSSSRSLVFVGCCCWLLRAPARPADARGDAEPAHGARHGHPHGAGRRADLRPRLRHRRHRRRGAVQIDNVGPNLGQSYIIDSFMVVVFGGVGNLWGTLVGALSLGVANKFLEPWPARCWPRSWCWCSSSCSSRSARAAVRAQGPGGGGMMTRVSSPLARSTAPDDLPGCCSAIGMLVPVLNLLAAARLRCMCRPMSCRCSANISATPAGAGARSGLGLLRHLSLGHGAFFALGGYAMGMYLMRQIGTRGVYGNPVLPDFMVFLNWKELPWYWHGFDMFWFAAC
jgi:hypothetical protein